MCLVFRVLVNCGCFLLLGSNEVVHIDMWTIGFLLVREIVVKLFPTIFFFCWHPRNCMIMKNELY